MSDLLLDLDALDSLYKDLLGVSCTFGRIDWASDAVASAVGHDGLAAKVNEFADSWDDRREKTVESLDALWKQAQSVVDGFREADQAMAEILTDGSC